MQRDKTPIGIDEEGEMSNLCDASLTLEPPCIYYVKTKACICLLGDLCLEDVSPCYNF